jgi:hypothetical protein
VRKLCSGVYVAGCVKCTTAANFCAEQRNFVQVDTLGITSSINVQSPRSGNGERKGETPTIHETCAQACGDIGERVDRRSGLPEAIHNGKRLTPH